MKTIASVLCGISLLLMAGCGGPTASTQTTATTTTSSTPPASPPPPPSGPTWQRPSFLLGLYSDASGGIPAYAKFCGYNVMEVLDGSFALADNQMSSYFNGTTALVNSIHAQGLGVYVILLTNESRALNVQNATQNLGLNEYQVLFNPVTDPNDYTQRINDVQTAVYTGFAAADGFEVFAGDPGGCVGTGCDVSQYLRFAQDYTNIVRKLETPAEVTLNTWAIANWGVSLGVALDFWNAETSLSQSIIDKDISYVDAITLPGHNLYRDLVFQLYTQGGLPVPNWPVTTAIGEIQSQRKHSYLWPYFIVDGDTGVTQTWQQAHFEVRYIQDLVQKAQSLGVNGVFVNCINCGIQMGNIYAYGQLTQHPDTAPQQILQNFAALIAQPGSVNQLTQVLIFMENHSWWSSQMPVQYQLPALPGQLTTYSQAIAALNQVAPLLITQSAAPLLMTPQDYLSNIASTLAYMQSNY